MSRPRQFVVLVVLCGTVALAGWGAARLGVFGSSGIENIATPIGDRGATRGAVSLSADAGWGAARLGVFGSSGIENSATPIGDRGATRGAVSLSADAGKPVDAPLASAMASVVAVARSHLTLPGPDVAPAGMSVGKTATADPGPPEAAGFSVADALDFEAPLPDSRPTPPPETRVQLASLSTSDPVREYPKPAARPVETPDECLVAEICIDEYLWSLYERTPKIDTNKVTEQIKSTIKKKGKTQGGIAREQVPAPRGRQETAQPRSRELSSSRFAPLT